MGHIIGKDIYIKLAEKIDGLSFRVAKNEKFYAILKELYSEEEADFIIKMPYSFSNIDRVAQVTNYKKPKLNKTLQDLSLRGLVVDLFIKGEHYYMPSPFVIGLFEFTMMRTGDNLKTEEWAKLFQAYLSDGAIYAKNFAHNEKFGVLRALSYEDTIDRSEYIQVLDYEKAESIIESTDKFAISICPCRHEKSHAGVKECETPLETCSTFGVFADSMIRNKFGREASKSEMKDNFARSKELGLVLSADNVQRGVTYVCHCCGCCCNVLLGISKHGYANTLVTSSFIAEIVDESLCIGCGKCAKACHINAIEIVHIENPKQKKKKKKPRIDKSICLGCGVCGLKCETSALKLIKRRERVIPPATTFERVILQFLEGGVLQNQMFDNPQSITHIFMRGFLGGFLRLTPVKKALMSDILRSSFLKAVKSGIDIQGKGWIADL